jgi:uncharacterized SAM-binding protein YcdF (DUF218 family)
LLATPMVGVTLNSSVEAPYADPLIEQADAIVVLGGRKLTSGTGVWRRHRNQYLACTTSIRRIFAAAERKTAARIRRQSSRIRDI